MDDVDDDEWVFAKAGIPRRRVMRRAAIRADFFKLVEPLFLTTLSREPADPVAVGRMEASHPAKSRVVGRVSHDHGKIP